MADQLTDQVPQVSFASMQFSITARAVISAVCHRDGTQTIVLSWPNGAVYLPTACYAPGKHDIVLGHVEGCPVYADLRRLALFRTREIVLDAAPRPWQRPHPPLWVRTLPAT